MLNSRFNVTNMFGLPYQKKRDRELANSVDNCGREDDKKVHGDYDDDDDDRC